MIEKARARAEFGYARRLVSDAAQPRETPQLELLEHAPERVFARWGILMIGCWRGRANIEHLRLLTSHYEEQRRRYPDGFFGLTILEHGVPFEGDREMTAYGRASRKELAPAILRSGYVIPHAGLGGTILRLTVNSIMRMSPSTPTKVFQNLHDALGWLGSGSTRIPEPERLELELAAALSLRGSTVRGTGRPIGG